MTVGLPFQRVFLQRCLRVSAGGLAGVLWALVGSAQPAGGSEGVEPSPVFEEPQPMDDATPEAELPTANEVADEVAMERATLDYESGHYELCISSFRRLLSRPAPRDANPAGPRALAHTYLAACLVAAGRMEQAREQFRVAILENRHLRAPDPIVFPRSVVDLFVQVRGQLMQTLRRQQDEELKRSREQVAAQRQRDAQERKRVRQLERLVQSETVVRQNERWMAWVPYGVGQFVNGDNTLGWALLGSEALLTAAAIAATSVELGLHVRGQGGNSNLEPADLNRALRSAHTVANFSWITLIGVASLGMLEANLSYESEVPLGVRQRQWQSNVSSSVGRARTPGAEEGLKLSPMVTPAWVGVQGTF